MEQNTNLGYNQIEYEKTKKLDEDTIRYKLVFKLGKFELKSSGLFLAKNIKYTNIEISIIIRKYLILITETI